MSRVTVTAGVSVTVTHETTRQSGFIEGEHKLFEEMKHEYGELVREVEEERSIADRLEAELIAIEEIPASIHEMIRRIVRKHVG